MTAGHDVRTAPHDVRTAPTVHLVTSDGGHIDLLRDVKDAFAGYRSVWIAPESLHTEAIAAKGDLVYTLPQYDRNLIRGHHASNIVKAARLALKERPSVVVTSGAGVTVPFCVFARLAGARIIFVESVARVTGPSASGKILARLASRTLVQWPELLSAYPRTSLCHPALLEVVSQKAAQPGSGTFVGVGTQPHQFNRLLAMVDEAVGKGVLPTPVVAQSGVCDYRPKNFELRDWLSPDAVESAVGQAEYVVCHAGSGFVSCALKNGRRPMVLTRLAAYGEHYDDHQIQIAAKLEELGLAIRLNGEITAEHLRTAAEPIPAIDRNEAVPTLKAALRSELETAGR